MNTKIAKAAASSTLCALALWAPSSAMAAWQRLASDASGDYFYDDAFIHASARSIHAKLLKNDKGDGGGRSSTLSLQELDCQRHELRTSRSVDYRGPFVAGGVAFDTDAIDPIKNQSIPSRSGAPCAVGGESLASKLASVACPS